MDTRGVEMALFLLFAFSGITAIYGAPMAAPVFVPDCASLHGAESYPNLQQLNTYYQCVHGTPILLYCPTRQEFNAAKGICEHLRSIDSYADVDTSGIKCLFEGEFICNPLNPKSFYQCSFGKPQLHDCPGGLNFNTELKVCDYTRPTDACELQGMCKFEGQYIINPHNPKSFYQCSHGVAILHNCPTGLTFNTQLNVCDYTEPQRSTILKVNEDPNCSGKPDGPNAKVGEELSRYYVICDGGKTAEDKTCPGTLELNPVFNQHTRTCEKDKEERDPCVSIEEEEGLFPDETQNCEFYFRCDNHRRVGDLRKCENGHRFSPRTLECDVPSNVCAPCGTKNC